VLSTIKRCPQCGKKVAEVVAVAKPRPRELPPKRGDAVDNRRIRKFELVSHIRLRIQVVESWP
jgi:hypothetical protein